MMNYSELKSVLKTIWNFIWNDDSIWSWLVNIVLAFVIIKFIVYPSLGLILGTNFPIVAVVSSSMEHNSIGGCVLYDESSFIGISYKSCVKKSYAICGNQYDTKRSFNVNEYWEECKEWYNTNTDISLEEFSEYKFKNGFNKGDIMILIGAKPQDINMGDVIVFQSKKPDPIIHRVVRKWSDNRGYHFSTKGDHNERSIKDFLIDETDIHESKLLGKAAIRIPLLGYVKIWFVELIKLVTF